MNTDETQQPDDQVIPDVQVLSYGPVDGEYHHDAMYGPAGNKLKPYQIAISPKIAQEHGLKLWDWVEVGGQPRQVADWSYLHPGQPTSNTVEIRDEPNVKAHAVMRVMTPDEVASKGLPGPETHGEILPPRVSPSAPGDSPNPVDPMIPLNGIPDLGLGLDNTGDAIRSMIDQTSPEALMASQEPTEAALESASAAAEDGALGDDELPAVEATSEEQAPQTQQADTGYVPPPGPTQRQRVVKREGRLVHFEDGTILDPANKTISWSDPAGNMWTYGPAMDKPVKIKTVGTPKRSPAEIFRDKAAEKGILPENYDTPEAYNEAAKAILGADVPQLIVDEIENGTSPPTLQGLYRYAAPVRAEFARRNKERMAKGEEPFNLTDAMMDYQAAQKHITALNASQQLRLTQSAKTAYDSLEIIDQLASKWKGGNFPILNKANLILASQGANGPEAQSLATQLRGQIGDLTFELGNVYMGGNTPTDQSLKLAQKNLSADWSEKTLHDMINLSKRNLQIRLNSMRQVGAAGLSAAGQARYGGQNMPAQPAQQPMIKSQADYDALPSGQKYQALGKDGKIHTFTKP